MEAGFSQIKLHIMNSCCDVYTLRCLKQDMIWAIDTQFWFIRNVMLLKTVNYVTKGLKNEVLLSLKQYCSYALLSGP